MRESISFQQGVRDSKIYITPFDTTPSKTSKPIAKRTNNFLIKNDKSNKQCNFLVFDPSENHVSVRTISSFPHLNSKNNWHLGDFQ
jgi:hypothetical protein